MSAYRDSRCPLDRAIHDNCNEISQIELSLSLSLSRLSLVSRNSYYPIRIFFSFFFFFFFFNYYRGERSLERLSRGGEPRRRISPTKKSALRRRVVTKREEKGKEKKGKGGKKKEIERERGMDSSKLNDGERSNGTPHPSCRYFHCR